MAVFKISVGNVTNKTQITLYKYTKNDYVELLRVQRECIYKESCTGRWLLRTSSNP